MASTNLQSRKMNKRDELQKMYVLTEPAFKTVKHVIDSEKYLSLLDKDLKKILYDEKLPNYKKWLHYEEVLAQYFNFREFLRESKANEDDTSAQQLIKVEKRLKQLERQLEQNAVSQNAPNVVTEVESPVKISEEAKNDSTPNKSVDLNESVVRAHTNKQKKRKSTTPSQPDVVKSQARRLDFDDLPLDISLAQPLDDSKLGDISLYTAPAGEEKIFGEQSLEKSKDEVMDWTGIASSIMPYPEQENDLVESDDLLRGFDDDLISQITLRQRLEAAPESVRSRFLINGSYPRNQFSVVYHDDDENEDHETSVNGLDATIIDGNVLRIYTNTGFTRIKNIKEDSLSKIRNYLIDFHQKIGDALDDYHQRRGNYVSIKPYRIRDLNENMKSVKYKQNAVVSVPNAILDELISILNTTDMSESEFKNLVKEMNKIYQYSLARPGLSQSHFSSHPVMDSPIRQSQMRGTSTPQSGKKRGASHLAYTEKTLKSLEQPKKSSKQEGSGIRWKKI